MPDCAHDCSSCGESCGERTAPRDSYAPANGLSHIRKVITVVNGRGGVDKSLVTSSLAVAMRRMGKMVDVLGADITGPSIPTTFGVRTKAGGSELGVCPAETKIGIGIMSLNLLAGDEIGPVVWHGPVIARAVKQFWMDVIWDDADYLLMDVPPGTDDVPLTMSQSLPVNGIVVATTPQDLVSTIVTETVKMAEMMYIPVLGLAESYSYFRCPDCGKEHAIFGESHIERVAAALDLKVLAHLLIDPVVTAACNASRIEELDPNYLTAVAELLME